MAFFLTPRFAPAYVPQGNPWSCTRVRPSYSYRRVSRPSFPSFVPFLSQVDELLSQLDREARRETHCQRQQRKRLARAHFNVHENDNGYQIDGEILGFEQKNLEIQVTDENTLRVAGNTEKAEESQPQVTPTSETKAIETEAQTDAVDVTTLNDPEQTASDVATSTHSDTESHRSYQATVEDDFEDLGAETASTLSAGSDTPAEPKEPKVKEKLVDEHANTKVAAQQQLQPGTPTPQQPQEDGDHFYGSFERTFRFPERIDAANVKANLKNGLLSIIVPKAKAPEVRRISIQ